MKPSIFVLSLAALAIHVNSLVLPRGQPHANDTASHDRIAPGQDTLLDGKPSPPEPRPFPASLTVILDDNACKVTHIGHSLNVVPDGTRPKSREKCTRWCNEPWPSKYPSMPWCSCDPHGDSQYICSKLNESFYNDTPFYMPTEEDLLRQRNATVVVPERREYTQREKFQAARLEQIQWQLEEERRLNEFLAQNRAAFDA